MKVTFQTASLQKLCQNPKSLSKSFGSRCAHIILKRLSELSAATSLEEFRCLPQTHCEELKGNRKGQLSVRVEHPKRIVFVPSNDPTPRKPDGGLDWASVTEIEIKEIVDYHG